MTPEISLFPLCFFITSFCLTAAAILLLTYPNNNNLLLPQEQSCAKNIELHGELNETSPPYFFSDQCALLSWDPTSARKCLEGRRIYILGNSIARAFAFEVLSRFFDGPSVLRQDQKAECKPSCTIPLGQAETNMSVEFVWTQLMGPSMPWCLNYPDPCYPSAPGDCLFDTLSQSRPGDVLITYVGLHYVVLRGDWETLKKTGKSYVCEEGVNAAEYKDTLQGIDEEGFSQTTEKDIDYWVDSIKNSWKGNEENVYRVRLAPVGDYFGTGIWAHWISWFNNKFDAAVLRTKWSTVDQYGINQGNEWDFDEARPVVPPHYADNIHFPGFLSTVTLEVVLSHLCPQGTKV